MKLESSNFQLSTSIIVATLVKNKFSPLREVPLKMYFFQKMSNVCFYLLMKYICSKFQLSTSIIVAAIVTNFFFEKLTSPWNRPIGFRNLPSSRDSVIKVYCLPVNP